MSVTLSPDQVAMAELIGQRRADTALRARSPDAHFPSGPDGEVRQHQHAAGAEIAAARILGGWWAATDAIPPAALEADLRLGRSPYQVRWTSRNGDDAFLMLYPADDERLPFILVTGRLPTYKVRGIIRCGEGRRDDYWRTHMPNGTPLKCPCWAVPQSALRRIPQS